MNRFWNWSEPAGQARDADKGERTLTIDGVIASESWFADDVTPRAFKDELLAGDGPITVWINSVGGDCVAASQIYTMLMEYPADVTVKIDGMAASAASVIAMAGTQVLMSPTSLMMCHNPLMLAIGDSEEMKKATRLLDEVKESIINAYEIKTSLPRATISSMMDTETWLNAKKAVELGFADGILYTTPTNESTALDSFQFSRMAPVNALLSKLRPKAPPDNHIGTPVADLDKRLALLSCAPSGL